MVYVVDNNTILEIKSADYKSDTGAYKCKAKNSAGTSDQVAAVFIENGETSKHSSCESVGCILHYLFVSPGPKASFWLENQGCRGTGLRTGVSWVLI